MFSSFIFYFHRCPLRFSSQASPSALNTEDEAEALLAVESARAPNINSPGPFRRTGASSSARTARSAGRQDEAPAGKGGFAEESTSMLNYIFALTKTFSEPFRSKRCILVAKNEEIRSEKN